MSDDFSELDLGETPDEFDAPSASGWEYLSDGGEIRCVFSSSKTVKMGMGANTRKHESLTYWFVEQVGDERFAIRRINHKNVPSGETTVIELHRLINHFKPQLAYYEDRVLPAMEDLEDILDQGDDFREDGQLYSAEMEYDRALTIEEKNVRALFGLGLVYSSRKEMERTRELLAELVKVKAAFDGKNQYLFNEFGIALRKNELFTESAVYYRRGLDFVTNDENLY
ncbi:tetratricopeptide repeat protein, partial [Pseudodesulfovibrio sp.]|nr:tetratricopeptide repeat protein [Pseudodesulfovibrio sp.]